LIRWPDKYKPERTAVHARTELEMPVPPEAVWPWLVRAELWPTWYPGFTDVVIDGGGHDLKPGSRFRWKTFGVRLDSKVEEFVEFERIAWTRAPRASTPTTPGSSRGDRPGAAS